MGDCHRLKDNVKVNLREVWCMCNDWIRVRCSGQYFEHIKPRGLKEAKNFLINCVTNSIQEGLCSMDVVSRVLICGSKKRSLLVNFFARLRVQALEYSRDENLFRHFRICLFQELTIY